MNANTRNKIERIIREFASSQAPKFRRWSISEVREAYPFHRIIFPDAAIIASRVERSIVTTMGSKLYPQLAEAIAKDKYKDVKTEHSISGVLNDAACNMVEQIVTELRAGSQEGIPRRQPNQPQEISDILNSRGGGTRTISVTADLFVEDFDKGPLFLELKTPLPNLDIAAESKRKMLYYVALKNREGIDDAKAFLGLTYNPFITRARYAHSFTKRIMDMDHEVLLGREMWDYLGGPETYDALTSIIDSIGPHGS